MTKADTLRAMDAGTSQWEIPELIQQIRATTSLHTITTRHQAPPSLLQEKHTPANDHPEVPVPMASTALSGMLGGALEGLFNGRGVECSTSTP